MRAAGALEPAAAAGAGARSTTRSEIAGVVTTDGPGCATGTRSTTRVVHAPSVAADAMIAAIVAFMRYSSLAGTSSAKLDKALPLPVRAAILQEVSGLQWAHEVRFALAPPRVRQRSGAGISLGRQKRHGELLERAAAGGRQGERAADRCATRPAFRATPGLLQRPPAGRADGRSAGAA